MTKAKILILLSLSLVIQSLSSVFIKFAGQYETLSREFIIFYVLAIGCLGIYAIMWQFLLELIPLTTAYLRKGILYILILFWSVLLFKEHVTVFMEWMNISYVLAFLAVFVASVSQILLKQSAEIEHKNILFKFLNWRVILGYGLLFGTTVINVFAYRGVELKVTPMIESTGIIWVTILAVFFLGERPTKRGLLSIAVTVLGIIVFSL